MKKLIENNYLCLDLEFGNADGFFSGSKKNSCDSSIYLGCFNRTFDTEIKGVKLTVCEKYDVSDAVISRGVNYSINAKSRIYDFVSRFVVFSNDRNAVINNISIRHKCSNIYYQYPVSNVKVPIGDSCWLNFENNNSSNDDLFENVFYIRDESVDAGMKKWIVHHRKIVKPEVAELIIRCCNPRLEGPLKLNKYIPRFIANKLFRIREARYPNFPFMAVGEVDLHAGFNVQINTKISLTHDQ